eukprot:TRINITY_DN2013_c2_g1_i1.p1 TRINITY_DN2013_c2_g1~~TRINITY_DN2013_c2_g1_i1.p1  ORF type:complete len:380 (+),score=57.01 TRINITY_DN2013_c2_g1_i1:61-1200(+)
MIIPDVGLTDSFDSIDMLVAHRKNAKESKEAKTPTTGHLAPGSFGGTIKRRGSFMSNTLKLQGTGKEYWKSESAYDKLGWEGRPIEDFIEKGETMLQFTGRGSFCPPPYEVLQTGKLIITTQTLYVISDEGESLMTIPLTSLERIISFNNHDLVIAANPDTELLILLEPSYATFFEDFIEQTFSSIREVHDSVSRYCAKIELHPQMCKSLGVTTNVFKSGRNDSLGGAQPQESRKDRHRAFEENIKFNRLQYLYKNEGSIAISDMYNRETKSHAKRTGLLAGLNFNSTNWKLKLTELLEQVVTIEKQQNANPAQLLEIYEAVITILERATTEIRNQNLMESSCRLLHHSRREVSRIQGILAKGKLLIQHQVDTPDPPAP